MTPWPLLENTVQKIFDTADVKINGGRLWDIQVCNPGFYRRALYDGSLGLGESYMDGWWDCQAIDQLFYNISRARLDERAITNPLLLLGYLKKWLTNSQGSAKAFEVGERHYDRGNDLYRNMLDRRMVYSCGYWRDADNLDEAQEAKLELVCRKLKLQSGMKLLDIGCGWGGMAKYVAGRYGTEVVGITVSREQVKLGRELCQGLPVDIRLQDYRDINERFDRVVSLGMFEHVGYKNYRSYMEIVHKCLNDDGLFLLHTIGRDTSETSTDPWIEKYIFPNGVLPSIKQVGDAVEGLFVMEDWHNFSAYYDQTLMSWFKNFHENWYRLKSAYNETFYKMWKYYLLSCAGLFRARRRQVWQIVLSKNGVINGYESVR